MKKLLLVVVFCVILLTGCYGCLEQNLGKITHIEKIVCSPVWTGMCSDTLIFTLEDGTEVMIDDLGIDHDELKTGNYLIKSCNGWSRVSPDPTVRDLRSEENKHE